MKLARVTVPFLVCKKLRGATDQRRHSLHECMENTIHYAYRVK